MPDNSKNLRSTSLPTLQTAYMETQSTPNLQWTLDLYTTIWSMVNGPKDGPLGDADILLLNTQDYPALIPDPLVPMEEVEKLCLGEYPGLQLDPYILRFPNLRYLDFGNNTLGTFPTILTGLPYLEELHLVSDSISSIPDEIGTFPALQRLTISACHLSEWNTALQDLPHLEYLDLSHNKLKNCPAWLSELSHLKTLNLSGNGLSKNSIPTTVLHKIEVLL